MFTQESISTHNTSQMLRNRFATLLSSNIYLKHQYLPAAMCFLFCLSACNDVHSILFVFSWIIKSGELPCGKNLLRGSSSWLIPKCVLNAAVWRQRGEARLEGRPLAIDVHT